MFSFLHPSDKKRGGEKGDKRYVGLNYAAHDGGMAVFDQEGNLLFAHQFERLSRRKSASLTDNVNALLTSAGLAPISGNDLIFSVRPSTVGEFTAKLEYEERPNNQDMLLSLSNQYKKLDFYHLSHHLAHAACSWMFRDRLVGDEDCLYIVFDGSGTKINIKGGIYSMGTIGANGLIDSENSLLLGSRLASGERLDKLKLFETNSLGVAGKLMGMAGHVSDAPFVPLEQINIAALNEKILKGGSTMGEETMRECASVYLSYIEDVKKQVDVFLKKYPNKNVVVGGGTFLALELNTYIAEKGRNVVLGPPPNDSGIALRSAALGYYLINKKWPKALDTPFLQWCPPQKPTAPMTPERAAAILVDENRPLGVIIGKGELGPRALGHRSLLAVPTPGNKKLVSETIKKREFYRPAAPIVTDRQFEKFFTGPKGKYMQYRNFCTPLARELIPAVVHNDNSARVQVLERKDNPWLYDVLIEVGKKTGAECLINTSLNGPGKPISNTAEDARKEMDTSLFELIVME